MQTQNDIRSSITNTIIDALKNGSRPPWREPWSNDPNAPGLHTSMSTGNPYRGINAMKGGFKSKWGGLSTRLSRTVPASVVDASLMTVPRRQVAGLGSGMLVSGAEILTTI